MRVGMLLNGLIDILKVRNIWLDENDDFGIIEMNDNLLGITFHPIEKNETWERDNYSIINYITFMSYSGARKNIEPYITGKLSKRSNDIINKT